MPRRRNNTCPPGVFCIENTTIFFLLLLAVIFLVVAIKYINKLVFNNNTQTSSSFNYLAKYFPMPVTSREHYITMPKMGAGISNNPRDILNNPYLPPLRDGRYFPKNSSDPRGIPINVPTRGFRSEWRQKGILTRMNGEETILPLMARPLYSNRQKWQYYTISDKNNMVKLPISKNGRSCTNDYGCDELFNGDNVYVEGYNDTFKVTVYENNTPEYIPFI